MKPPRMRYRDVLVLIARASFFDKPSFKDLAARANVSCSQAHGSIAFLKTAALINYDDSVNYSNVAEFVQYGLKYLSARK